MVLVVFLRSDGLDGLDGLDADTSAAGRRSRPPYRFSNPQPITALTTLSALSSPVQRSLTPRRKPVRGLRGLAKVVGRTRSQNQGGGVQSRRSDGDGAMALI